MGRTARFEPSDAQPVARVRYFRIRDAVLLVLTGAALLFAYRSSLGAMLTLWNISPMYSYGYTVPVISGFLLWSRRSVLASVPLEPARAVGGLVLLTSLAMSVAARAGGIQVLDQLAFLVSLCGVLLVFFGTRFVRAVWAPLAYLLLMVPLWDGFTERLHWPFQLRSAEIGLWILQTLGIPAYRDGTMITLPGIVLEVARACSGVNYLVAVLALGLPLSYLYLEGVWRRVVLLLGSILVAALSNGLRVALIGVLVYFDIGTPLHGPFHTLHGLFVSGIGFVALFAGLHVLRPRAPGGSRTTERPAPQAAPSMPSPLSIRTAAVLVTLFVALGTNVFARSPRHVPLEDGLNGFPTRLGAWTAEPGALPGRRSGSAEDTRWPGADAEVSRRFTRADGAAADVYIAYFASQRQDKELVTHRTTEWHNRGTRVRIGEGMSEPFDANMVRRPDGRVMLFWYYVDGALETERVAVKARTLLSAITSGRTNGSVITVTSVAPLAADREPETADLVEIAALARNAMAVQMPGGDIARAEGAQ